MILGAGGVLALLAWPLDGWTTAAGLLLITASTAQGVRLGAAQVGGVVLGTGLALLLAGPLGRMIEPGIGALIGTKGLMNRALSIGVVGGGIIVIGGFAGGAILKAVTPSDSAWRRRNAFAGGVLGFLEGLALVLGLMWVLLALQPVARERLKTAKQPAQPTDRYVRRREPVSEIVNDIAESLQATRVGRGAAASNPIAQARILAVAEAFAAISRDAYAMRFLLASEAMKRVRALRSYNTAASMASGDVDLTHFFTDTGVDAPSLQELVSNSTLLRIYDETTILADMAPLADEFEAAVHAAREQIGKDPVTQDDVDAELEAAPGMR